MKLTPLFSALLLCTLSFSALAQTQAPGDSLYRRRGAEQPKPGWMERISLGGNFGASFGAFTHVNISPLVGYRVTNRLMAGGGVTYLYSRIQSRNGRQSSSSYYGGRLMANYAIIPQFAPHVEYEVLSAPSLFDASGRVASRRWIGNPMVGATVLLPVGRRSNFGLTALYNLNYRNNEDYSPYPSPWVLRMGFML